MKKQTIYLALSPDGIPISDEPEFSTLYQANSALKYWAHRYQSQGYYSTVRDGERMRIPYDQIVNHCDIQKIEKLVNDET